MSMNEEQVGLLTQLWADGVPARDIGTAIGTSKNAVIGKARRLHLTPRKPGYASGHHYLRRPKPKPRIVIQEAPVLPTHPTGSPVSLLEAGYFHCRWPITEVSPIEKFLYCGNQKIKDSSYCQHHFNMSRPTR